MRLGLRCLALFGALSAVLMGCTLDFNDDVGVGGQKAATSTATASSSGGTGGGTTGAGGSSAMFPFFGDGSRLKANYTDGGGGAKLFVSWFDTQLGMTCVFQPFAGEERCVPTTGTVSNYYGDMNCMKPLMYFIPSACNKNPVYASVGTPPSSCSTPNSNSGTPSAPGYVAVHSAGAPYNSPTVYLKNGAGVCISTSSNVGYDFAMDGSVVDPGTFVRASPMKMPRGDKLFEEILVADDGAWQLNRVFSGTSQCRLQVLNNNPDPLPTPVAACTPIYGGLEPTVLAAYPLYSDSGCGMPTTVNVGYFNPLLCSPPEYIRATVEDAKNCIVKQAFYSVGTATAPETYYSGTPGMCNVDSPSNVNWVTLGAEIDPTTQFGLIETQTYGTGPLQAVFYGTGPNEPIEQPRGWLDVATGKQCYLYDFGTAVRCIDIDIPEVSNGVFSDPACHTAVLITSVPNCGSAGPTPTRALLAAATQPACSSIAAVSGMFDITSYSGTLYSLNNNVCGTVTLPPGQSAFSLGTSPLDTSGFPTATIVKH